MSVISDVKERIKNKFEEREAIKDAEKNAREEIRNEYIRGKIEEKKRLAYEKGKESANKKRGGIFSGIVKPFSPDEIKAMSNNYQTNPNSYSNPSQTSSSNFTPIIMTSEMEAINKLKGGK